MRHNDLFPSREDLELFLPDWFINWVLGPLPAEYGWVAFLAKQVAMAVIFWNIVDLFLSPALSELLARSLMATGLAGMAACIWRR